MKIAFCKQCGRRYPAYDGEQEYHLCRDHVRAFLFRNPEYLSKQINDVSSYFSVDELRDISQSLRG